MATKSTPGRTFGTWLGHQLDRRDWNGADLARRLGVANGVVSRWVRGERIPSPASCRKIADVLFLDVDEVLTIAGHRDPDLHRDHLERIHAEIDPYLRDIAWDDRNRFDVISTLERIIRFQEMQAGTRQPERIDDDEAE